MQTSRLSFKPTWIWQQRLPTALSLEFHRPHAKQAVSKSKKRTTLSLNLLSHLANPNRLKFFYSRPYQLHLPFQPELHSQRHYPISTPESLKSRAADPFFRRLFSPKQVIQSHGSATWKTLPNPISSAPHVRKHANRIVNSSQVLYPNLDFLSRHSPNPDCIIIIPSATQPLSA